MGAVRSKFASIPIPGSEVSLDGDTLRSEGAVEQEALISSLREDLEQSSKRNTMERENEITTFRSIPPSGSVFDKVNALRKYWQKPWEEEEGGGGGGAEGADENSTSPITDLACRTKCSTNFVPPGCGFTLSVFHADVVCTTGTVRTTGTVCTTGMCGSTQARLALFSFLFSFTG